MPAEPRSLKQLFLDALGVEPARRAAWLKETCGADADLRKRLEAMLAAHDAPQSMLDRPLPIAEGNFATTSAFPQPAADGPGTVIGAYKLLEQIGEGGFGVV